MNKKKFFELLTSAAMILNWTSWSALAEEMVEASGDLEAVINADGTVAVDQNNFPDEKLLAEIKSQNDNVTDAAKVTTLSLTKDEVKDFSGLQYLTGLNNLEISGSTSIEVLKLSPNTELKTLILNNNEVLHSVTLPQTKTLSTILITKNPALTSLDLSPASILTSATISKNAISQLDVSNNPFLTYLDASSNKLYSLDTTACPNLSTLNVAGNKIYELKVIDQSIGDLNVAGNKLREFDGSNMSKLYSLNLEDNMLGHLKLPTYQMISYLNVNQNHLAALNLDDVLVLEGSPKVIAGNQSLILREEDEAIDLKAYDENFKESKAKILDKNGKPSKTTLKNGVLSLVSSGNNSGKGGSTITPSHQPPATPDKPSVPAEQVSLKAKLDGEATSTEVKVVFESEALTSSYLDLENATLTLYNVMGIGEVNLEDGTTEKVSLKFEGSNDNPYEWIAVPDPAEEFQAESERMNSVINPWRVGMGMPFNIIVTGVITISGQGIATTSFTFQIGNAEENVGLTEEFTLAQSLKVTDDPTTPDTPNTPDDPADEAIDLSTTTIAVTYTGLGTEKDPYIYTITVNGKEVPTSDLTITPVVGTEEAPNPDANKVLKVTVAAPKGSTVYKGSREVDATTIIVELTAQMVKVLYTDTHTPVLIQIKEEDEDNWVTLSDDETAIQSATISIEGDVANITSLGTIQVPAGYTFPKTGLTGVVAQEVTALTQKNVVILCVNTDTLDKAAYTATKVYVDTAGTTNFNVENPTANGWKELGEADSFTIGAISIAVHATQGTTETFALKDGSTFEANGKTYFLNKPLQSVNVFLSTRQAVTSENFQVFYTTNLETYEIQITTDPNANPVVWTPIQNNETSTVEAIFGKPVLTADGQSVTLDIANEMNLWDGYTFGTATSLSNVKAIKAPSFIANNLEVVGELDITQIPSLNSFTLTSINLITTDDIPSEVEIYKPKEGENTWGPFTPSNFVYNGETKTAQVTLTLTDPSQLAPQYQYQVKKDEEFVVSVQFTAEPQLKINPISSTIYNSKIQLPTISLSLFTTLGEETTVDLRLVQDSEGTLRAISNQEGDTNIYSVNIQPLNGKESIIALKDAGTYRVIVLTTIEGISTPLSGTAEYTIKKRDLKDTTITLDFIKNKNMWKDLANNDYYGNNGAIQTTTDVRPLLVAGITIDMDSHQFEVPDEDKVRWEIYPTQNITILSTTNAVPEGTQFIIKPSIYQEDPNYEGIGSYTLQEPLVLTESPQITSVSKEFSQADVDSVLEEVDAAAGYAYEVQGNNNMMVYAYKESIVNRLYNPNSGEHFYTKDVNEKNALVKFGWQDEGVGWFAPQANVSTTPVYRLYNRNAGDHHYTKDSHEKDTLLAIGWTFEGISWYSATDPKAYDANGTSNRTIEVFREYNPNTKEAGSHNYTISEHENATLISVGWVDEGIAWNALK